MILDEIIQNKKLEIEKAKNVLPIRTLLSSINFLPTKSSFSNAISRPGKISLIAELKKKSPSAGTIFNYYNPLKIAGEYIRSGARALSILTDDKYFGGSLEDIAIVKSRNNISVLRKDFIIDKYQVFESKYHGADAILLIARILDEKELETFLYLTREIGLDALVEVHNEEEAKRAVNVGADIIGINNRNLDTLEVNLKITEKIINVLPKNVTIVSESGIKTHDDMEYLQKLGVNAVLIGESFLKSGNIPSKVTEIMGT